MPSAPVDSSPAREDSRLCTTCHHRSCVLHFTNDILMFPEAMGSTRPADTSVRTVMFTCAPLHNTHTAVETIFFALLSYTCVTIRFSYQRVKQPHVRYTVYGWTWWTQFFFFFYFFFSSVRVPVASVESSCVRGLSSLSLSLSGLRVLDVTACSYLTWAQALCVSTINTHTHTTQPACG